VVRRIVYFPSLWLEGVKSRFTKATPIVVMCGRVLSKLQSLFRSSLSSTNSCSNRSPLNEPLFLWFCVHRGSRKQENEIASSFKYEAHNCYFFVLSRNRGKKNIQTRQDCMLRSHHLEAWPTASSDYPWLDYCPDSTNTDTSLINTTTLKTCNALAGNPGGCQKIEKLMFFAICFLLFLL